MNDFFKIIDGLMKDSINKHKPDYDDSNIKKCVSFLNNGGKIIEYKSIPNSFDIYVVFSLNEEITTFKLSLSEQKAWALFLERRKELKNVKFL